MTEAGPLELLSEDEGEDSDQRADIKLPGVTKGENYYTFYSFDVRELFRR